MYGKHFIESNEKIWNRNVLNIRNEKVERPLTVQEQF